MAEEGMEEDAGEGAEEGIGKQVGAKQNGEE
jgi:hypothetical protein